MTIKEAIDKALKQVGDPKGSQFVQGELLEEAAAALSKIQGYVFKLRRGYFLVVDKAITVPAGAKSVAMPTDARSFIEAIFNSDGMELDRIEVQDRCIDSGSIDSYFLAGTKIYFSPIPELDTELLLSYYFLTKSVTEALEIPLPFEYLHVYVCELSLRLATLINSDRIETLNIRLSEALKTEMMFSQDSPLRVG